MEELDTIGKRLRFLRISAGMSQDKVAWWLHLASRSSISGYENDTRVIPVEMVIKYSEKFHVTTDWILKGVDKSANDIEKLYYSFGNADLQKIAIEQMRILSELRI